ncbi:hypothetical protein DL765_002887 [Monosporascus sp. GIB2]|nr:hypothetical protein DL765_002887 [Monosporascus sp. GIB2]
MALGPAEAGLQGQIRRIRHAFGTASISCGVLHQGKVIFHHFEGFADIEEKLASNADRVYPTASCTKAFTSATCAALVHEGLLSWDEPISSYLPEFQTIHNPQVGRRATLVDIYSHATGLAPVDLVVLGFHDGYYTTGADQEECECKDIHDRGIGRSEGVSILPGIGFTRSAFIPLTSEATGGENSYGLG